MSANPSSIPVVHRPEAQCFEAIVEGQRCVADYRLQGQILSMTHTVVPPALEGRGIAAALVNAALVWAQAQGFKVDPVCSYVRAYLQRHPEWQSLRA
jgi:predicted GNAT family acetyltransferase